MEALMTLPSTVRIVLVDDHPLIRDGLKARLQTHPDWTVCGEAETADEAIVLIRNVKPTVAIVDLSLKQGSGLDLIKQICVVEDAPKVLVCSMYDEQLYAQRALQAGARGFLHKQQAADQLISAIERILEGKIYVSDEVSELVLSQLTRDGRQVNSSPFERLTDRELAVFELIGRGSTMQQIAQELHLSVKTVETYRERTKRKLNVRTSAELLRYAVKWITDHASE